MLLTAILMVVTANAQPDSGSSSELIIKSSPPGAQITLEGDEVLSAVTPTRINYPLSGEYKLSLKLSGYEKYKTKLLIDPSRSMQFDVELTPKTGIKAAARSIFIPGWGQYYTEQRTKGFVFTLLFAGAATAFLVADHKFNVRENDYLNRLDEYDNALNSNTGYDELQTRLDAVTFAQGKAFDAEDVRRVTVGAVATVWGLGILDVLLLTPSKKGFITVNGLTVEPSTNSETIGLKLTGAF